MREFVGRGDTGKQLADISTIVEKAVSLAMAGALDPGITLRLDLAKDAPPVLADVVQLQQVVVNLVRNATEAMRGSARQELLVTTLHHGLGTVAVSIADTGLGLSNDLVERLFEPFITTKQDGMGVGLSISHSIVEAHGGRLEAEARSGGGMVFRFVLPAVLSPQDKEELTDAR